MADFEQPLTGELHLRMPDRVHANAEFGRQLANRGQTGSRLKRLHHSLPQVFRHLFRAHHRFEDCFHSQYLSTYLSLPALIVSFLDTLVKRNFFSL
jgi:hypothetical protein